MNNNVVALNKIDKYCHGMTTLEIAELTGKEHFNVLRDTRNMLTELYGENGAIVFECTYIDSQNKQRPCYNLPKNELLTLVSGYSVPLRAKIIKRLEELEQGNAIYEKPERKENFELELLGAKYCADILNYSEISKLQIIHAVYENNGVPTKTLPVYITNVRTTFAAKDLLKKNNCSLSPIAFNKKMIEKEFLTNKERTGSGGEIKTFKVLTEKGLKYGQNDSSKHAPRETQPHYFEDTFMELYELIQ